MVIFLILILFVSVFLMDFLPLKSTIPPKAKALYLFFFVLSFVIVGLSGLDIKIPSPTKLIETVVYVIVPSMKV